MVTSRFNIRKLIQMSIRCHCHQSISSIFLFQTILVTFLVISMREGGYSSLSLKAQAITLTQFSRALSTSTQTRLEQSCIVRTQST